MIKSVTFHAETPGPRLLVFGAIHGDEICGPLGINRIIPEFESGALKLKQGRVTFVPICNPRAYERNVRYIERNLNRNFLPQDVPDCYEAQLANLLCPLIRDCDVLLDIHSYHVGGPAFTFIDPADKPNAAFAAALGTDTVVSNFAGATAATENSNGDAARWSIGTTEYARMFDAMSVTLECGQHRDPQGPEIAYQAIRGALRHLGMIEGGSAPLPPRHVKMVSAMFREDMGGFAKPWRHLDTVPAGTVIARRANGEELRAAQDSVIILPRAEAEVGAEWFYLGVETPID